MDGLSERNSPKGPPAAPSNTEMLLALLAQSEELRKGNIQKCVIITRGTVEGIMLTVLTKPLLSERSENNWSIAEGYVCVPITEELNI